MSDKYALLEVLKDTAATEVLLVRHRSLNTQRIIKKIPVTNFSAEGCLEVDLIKDLHHPSIPVIYDFKVSNGSFIIVEEYIYGQSLKEILSLNDSISEEFLIWTAKKLCNVLEYLHTRNEPILYQDLKPEHIIYQENELRLIDFGIAEYLHSSEAQTHYGTKGYAAPEQYLEGTIDEGVDIYAFGQVLKEIATNLSQPASFWISKLIEKCTRQNRADRFSSFEEISKYINANQKQKKKGKKDLLLGSIAISGATSGVGVTHIAIALTSALRAMGINAIYKDCTDKHAVCEMEKEDCLTLLGAYGRKKAFMGELELGPGIDAKKEESLFIKDFGTDVGGMSADVNLYIVAGRAWQIGNSKENGIPFCKSGKLLIVCNQGNSAISRNYSAFFKKDIFLFPTDKDPVTPFRVKRRFVKRILKEGLREENSNL